jgi:hypothetical protein
MRIAFLRDIQMSFACKSQSNQRYELSACQFEKQMIHQERQHLGQSLNAAVVPHVRGKFHVGGQTYFQEEVQKMCDDPGCTKGSAVIEAPSIDP